MPICDIGLDTLNVSFIQKNPKKLALEAGSGNTHHVVTPPKPVL
jgi:hypothetical protein